MEEILVQKIEQVSDEQDLASISGFMDSLKTHAIRNSPWPEFHADCEASFAIAYHKGDILLKFYIKESDFKASARPINDDVHKDNCVEFFIGFPNEEAYYNIEINCLGSSKVGYGKSRSGRTMMDENIIRKMRIQTAIDLEQDEVDDYFCWEAFLLMPKELFYYTTYDDLEGLRCRANFYKCGDELPQPHYLAWNKIESEHPDFHQPAFFGSLLFDEHRSPIIDKC